jgi:hypothetical protein
MCHAEPSLRDIARNAEAHAALLAAAWNEDRQDAPAASGWLARAREALAGWKRKDARA